MPAGPMTMSRLIETLNEVGNSQIFPQFDESTILLDRVDKGGDDGLKGWNPLALREGKNIRLNAHVTGNPNTAVATREGHQYTRPGSQGYDALRYRLRRMVTGMAKTTEAVNRAGGDPQSAFAPAAAELSAEIANIRKRMNKIMMGDGSGLIATAGATTPWNDTTKVLNVDDASQFAIDQEVVLRDKTGGSSEGGGSLPTGWTTATNEDGIVESKPAKVTAIDTSSSPNTITLEYYNGDAISLTTAATQDDGVYQWDTQGGVPWGLAIAASTANPSAHGWTPGGTPPTDEVDLSVAFGAVNRNTAANAWWLGYYLNLAGKTISLKDHLQPLRRALVARKGTLANRVSMICVCDPAIVDQVVNALTIGQRTFKNITIDTKKPDSLHDGLYDAVGWDIFAFVGDSDAPAGSTSTAAAPTGKMLFCDPEDWFRYILTPWQLEAGARREWNQTIGSFNRPTSKWYAYLETEQQNVFSSCRAMAQLDNVKLG